MTISPDPTGPTPAPPTGCRTSSTSSTSATPPEPTARRAHVAAPVAPATALSHAINWSSDQAEDLIRGDLRVLVTGPSLVARSSLLQRLRTRGVRIGTAEQAAGARSLHGTVIAFCPDAAMLAAAEALPGVRAVVAVAASNDPLREWVAACAPQHLGGAVLPAGPEAAPAAPRRAPSALESVGEHFVLDVLRVQHARVLQRTIAQPGTAVFQRWWHFFRAGGDVGAPGSRPTGTGHCTRP